MEWPSPRRRIALWDDAQTMKAQIGSTHLMDGETIRRLGTLARVQINPEETASLGRDLRHMIESFAYLHERLQERPESAHSDPANSSQNLLTLEVSLESLRADVSILGEPGGLLRDSGHDNQAPLSVPDGG